VPNLKAWLTRCLDRPAARKALALKSAADAATPADVTRRIAKLNRL
jgi:glutathione S-transferase